MFKTIRAAGLTAAAAFLCLGNSAAAAQASDPVEAGPAIHAAATSPATPLGINGATTTAEPAASTAPLIETVGPVTEHSIADTSLTPGRTRPDRVSEPAPVVAPASGITAAATDRPAGIRLALADLVASHAGTESSDEQFQCLASAVYFESRGEPLEGQLAVAEVILNRVKSGRFRATICDVVKQPSQFSFVRRGVIPEAPRASAAWSRAVGIAHIAMNELADVTGEDSLFFHATYVNPRWGRPRVAKIGNHIFYR